MREALGNALVEYGKKNKDVVVLDADVSSSTKTCKFKDVYPDRFLNVGIAEPGMIDTAVGLAISGKIPFVSSFAAILCYRGLEQIRTCVTYNNANVKLLSGYAGVSDYKDGATHHAIFDLAIMRAMPNMTVVNPGNREELKHLIPAVAEYPGPVYMRISRANISSTINITDDFTIGKGRVLKGGKDITLMVSGTMMNRTLEASKILEDEGLSTRVVEFHTLKPFDKELAIKCAEETKAIVTVEEHSIIGGLFGAVSETMARTRPVPIIPVGIRDKYMRTAPDIESLWDYCGLRPEDIVTAARKIIREKLGGD
jgi:transketolase